MYRTSLKLASCFYRRCNQVHYVASCWGDQKLEVLADRYQKAADYLFSRGLRDAEGFIDPPIQLSQEVISNPIH